MSNPVDNLIDCMANMQACVKCGSPLTQLDDARCPTCSASVEFGQQLRESTLDAAVQHQRLDAAEDVFNAVSVMQGDITREQHDQLREEAQDLDYSDDSQCSSEEDDDAEVDSTVGSSTGRSLVAAAGKRRVSCAGKGKAVAMQNMSSHKGKGKFAARIMTRKQPPKEADGKVRTQVCGQVAERCAMDENRLHKIHTLMAKHNNFAKPEDLDDPAAMVDHFECLMILDEASTRNSHGKGSRYPRFLRDYVGHGKCYLYHSEITRSSQPSAHAFIDNFIRTVKIHTQNVNVKGSKVPAMQAPVKAREAKIRHLVNSHKHGIDDYLNLLDKLREGIIKLPEPPSADAGTARSIVASGGRPRGRSWEAAVSKPPQSPKRMRFLGDPNSPSAAGTATIPGLDSDDDADDADYVAVQ